MVRTSLASSIASPSRGDSTTATRLPDDTGVEGKEACDCFITSGPDSSLFRHHRFYDFRTPNPNARGSARPDSNSTGRYNPQLAPHSLHGTPFLRDWAIQIWHRPGTQRFPVTIVNSDDNVFISSKGGDDNQNNHLVLRAIRLQEHVSTSEVQTRITNILHCSIRAHLRLYSPDTLSNAPNRILPPASGAVSGIFTYSYFAPASESDLEILTSDPNDVIHYTNQPAWDPRTDLEIPGSHTVHELSTPWTTYATHRLDWLPDRTRWYLDGEMQEEKSYGVPQYPSLLIVNSWSDGGAWSGNMSLGESAYLGIEWIEMAYNTSDVTDLYMGGEVIWEDDTDWDGAYDPEKERGMFRHPNPRPRRRPNLPKKEDGQQGIEEKECTTICRIDYVESIGSPEPI